MIVAGATTPDQRESESNDNEELCCIPQSPSITGASPSDCFASYLGHSLVGINPLQRCSLRIFQFGATELWMKK